MKKHKKTKRKIKAYWYIGALAVVVICIVIIVATVVRNNTNTSNEPFHDLNSCLEHYGKNDYMMRKACYDKYNNGIMPDETTDAETETKDDGNTQQPNTPSTSEGTQYTAPQNNNYQAPSSPTPQTPETPQDPQTPQVNCTEILDYLNGKYWVVVNAANQWLEDAADEWAHSQLNTSEGYIEAYKIQYKRENQYQVDNKIMEEYYSATGTATEAGCGNYINSYSW